MKILARGAKVRIAELKQKLEPVNASWTCIDDTDLISANVADFDIIFDLNFDDHPDQLKYLAQVESKPVFLSAVKIRLAEAVRNLHTGSALLIGLNALHGFINRSLAEVSLADPKRESELKAVMQKLQWDFRLVEDRVGMVTPRILFMIINEACYTVQEGTASIADVDTSMKLGTNYPSGPFEWADLIGIHNVYETLEALYADTHEERYKVCPMLKTHYLKNQRFY